MPSRVEGMYQKLLSVFIVIFCLLAFSRCNIPVCKYDACHIRQKHAHDGVVYRHVPKWKFWYKQDYRTAEGVEAIVHDTKRDTDKHKKRKAIGLAEPKDVKIKQKDGASDSASTEDEVEVGKDEGLSTVDSAEDVNDYSHNWDDELDANAKAPEEKKKKKKKKKKEKKSKEETENTDPEIEKEQKEKKPKKEKVKKEKKSKKEEVDQSEWDEGAEGSDTSEDDK